MPDEEKALDNLKKYNQMIRERQNIILIYLKKNNLNVKVYEDAQHQIDKITGKVKVYKFLNNPDWNNIEGMTVREFRQSLITSKRRADISKYRRFKEATTDDILNRFRSKILCIKIANNPMTIPMDSGLASIFDDCIITKDFGLHVNGYEYIIETDEYSLNVIETNRPPFE